MRVKWVELCESFGLLRMEVDEGRTCISQSRSGRLVEFETLAVEYEREMESF